MAELNADHFALPLLLRLSLFLNPRLLILKILGSSSFLTLKLLSFL